MVNEDNQSDKDGGTRGARLVDAPHCGAKVFNLRDFKYHQSSAC